MGDRMVSRGQVLVTHMRPKSNYRSNRSFTTTPGNKAISVKIFFPTLHETREYFASEGETIQSIAQREPHLQEHLVCSCGGNAACSTCHVYVDPHFYGLLEPPNDEETDMLDLAYGYREGVSRLGCRIHMSKQIDGIKLVLPEGSNNLF
jgi:ferredoxin